jgi:hypothetical protein
MWKKGHTLKQLLKRELGIQRGWPSGNRLRQVVELTQLQKDTFHIYRRICEHV